MLQECSATPFLRLRAPFLAVSLLASLAVSPGAFAQSARLDGTWSGGGEVQFASGQSERARCRAHYDRMSAGSYRLRAVCATPSGRASQTATLRHIGGNRYEGSFYNREYDVRGTIYVAVGGDRQRVRLSSESGRAFFVLRR